MAVPGCRAFGGDAARAACPSGRLTAAGGASGADVAWLEHVWAHEPPPLQIRVLVELHDVVYDGFAKLGHPRDLSRG